MRAKFNRSHPIRRNIFEEVNAAASSQISSLAESWLTTTKRCGDNLVALNPTRDDRILGSFSINTKTGVWKDFATGDAGGDIISFYAYLHGASQIESARELAQRLEVAA